MLTTEMVVLGHVYWDGDTRLSTEMVILGCLLRW
jgi:hypothetical protein